MSGPDAAPAAAKPKDAVWRGLIGLGLSLVLACIAAAAYLFPAADELRYSGSGDGLGQAYAGLAILYVAVLIFLGVFLAGGLGSLIYFAARRKHKSLIVTVIQLTLGGVLLVLFLTFLA
jgi:hypothetical protein